jgi:long-subunit acyl-CoA synthetase (AMP-forming)
MSAAALHPDAELVVASAARAGAHRLGDIVADGLRFAAGLRARGMRPSDIIAVQLPAWREWMVACVGIAHIGAVILPIVSIYGSKELGFILRQSGAPLLVTPDHWRSTAYATVVQGWGPLPALVGHAVVGISPSGTIPWHDMLLDDDVMSAAARSPDDLAMLVYTSGTTADPKGVCHSSRSLLLELSALFWARRAVTEIVLSPWPPGHVAGA